jgi:glycosyltransferase involved in cell wall biosynthesis
MIVTALVLFLFAVFSLVWLVRWTRLAAVLPTIEPNSAFPLPEPLPLVSVILPVRNEEDNIRTCLESLLKQEAANVEIIVVNDRSEDRTAEILRDIQSAHDRERTVPSGPAQVRLKILQGLPCPPNWMGKNHALDQGFQQAKGEFLLFVDADTRAHPRLVEKTVGYCLKSGTGLLTLIHSCEFQCFWDSVVNSLILYLAPFQEIERFNDPSDSRGNANGPFMLFRRDVYERIGGHRAIAGEVVEDLVIARRVKESGARLTWAIAPELFVSRPYASLGDLRRGWGKVLFRCMELDPKLIRSNLILPVLLLIYLLFPLGAAACSLLPGVLDWSGGVRFAMISLAAVQALSIVAGHRFVQILFRLHPTYPWAYVLGGAALALVQWEACFRVLTGRKVAWKGREYREEKK